MIRSNGSVTTIVCDHRGCRHTVAVPAPMRMAKSIAELRGWECSFKHYCYLHKEDQ